MQNGACRICLFGHRNFDGYRVLDTRLSGLIKELIDEKGFIEFYIGRNGEFDVYSASIIKKIQKEIGETNTQLICVLPYNNKDIEFYSNYYDDILIPEVAEKSHPKNAITKRNNWMVEICDIVICYVERNGGGAYSAMQHARRLGKKVIDLVGDN